MYYLETSRVVEERESECGGEMDQGLLKRVGASLEKTKILGKEKSERRRKDSFMKKNEHEERDGECFP